MPRHTALVLLVLGATACQDQPVGPDAPPAPLEDRPALTAARTLVPGYTCTRSWASGVDGDWYDAGNWSPAGAPSLTDNVCIDAPGTYTVTADYDVLTTLVQVGGAGATATLRLEHSLLVDEGIVVEAGSRLQIDGAQTVHLGSSPPASGVVLPDADWFENRGVVEIENGCGCTPPTQWHFRSILNLGWMSVAGPARFVVLGELGDTEGRDFENRGILLTSGADTIKVTAHTNGAYSAPRGGAFRQTGGTIGGSAPIRVDRFGDFVWDGGTLPVNTANPALPLLALGDVQHLWFNDPALDGHVQVEGGTWIDTDIGPGVRLRVDADLTHGNFLWFQMPNAEVRNSGTIELVTVPASGRWGDFMIMWSASGPPAAPGRFTNDGTITSVGGGDLVLTAVFGEETHVTNTGTISVADQGQVRVDASGPAGTPSTLIHTGLITAEPGSEFEIHEGTMTISGSGRMTGQLVLDHATLRGRGTLDRVLSTGGTLSPGTPGPTVLGISPRYGTLTMSSLVLDAQSEVTAEVGGTTPDRYDRIVVSENVHYDGTLRAVTVAPFQGGVCGQVIPILTDNTHTTKTPLARGAFGTLQGFALDATRAWRLHNPDGVLALAGYQPGPDRLYATRSSVVLAEGGSPRTYSACLGDAAPTSDVTVTPTAQQGELLVSPPFTVTPTDWALPRSLTVRAIDDAAVQGLHTDQVQHRMTSPDPRYNDPNAAPIDATIQDNDGEADLSLLQVSQEDNQFVGDVMNTVFRVTNAGPTESSGSTVVSTPLTGLGFVSATGATCTATGGVVTCAVGPVPSGGQVDVTVTFEGLTVGLHTSTWTVQGQQPDPDATNDAVDYTQRVN
ncbi:MAG: DUF11 domain-containing protein [Gemmatimonadota bacterium]